MKYKILLIALIGFYTTLSYSQNLELPSKKSTNTYKDSLPPKKTTYYIAYDFGEALFNQFKSLGSEVGVQFKNNHQLRLAYTHLYLSEKHLSSDFAKAVDGENVEGKQVGYEIFYDFPVFIKGLYIAPSLGYYDHKYTHTITNEKLQKDSFTLGTAISFSETNIFKVKGLYYRVSIPFRYTLDPIEKTQLGDTTINSNQFDNNIWFFVGFQF